MSASFDDFIIELNLTLLQLCQFYVNPLCLSISQTLKVLQSSNLAHNCHFQKCITGATCIWSWPKLYTPLTLSVFNNPPCLAPFLRCYKSYDYLIHLDLNCIITVFSYDLDLKLRWHVFNFVSNARHIKYRFNFPRQQWVVLTAGAIFQSHSPTYRIMRGESYFIVFFKHLWHTEYLENNLISLKNWDGIWQRKKEFMNEKNTWEL